MRIEHIAVWCKDIETMKDFYESYFLAEAGDLYVNEAKGFSSYLLKFPKSSSRLELMTRKDVTEVADGDRLGLAHIAFGVDSKEVVNELTELIANAGFGHIGGPRVTGDGYYESTILDPEGNVIEICFDSSNKELEKRQLIKLFDTFVKTEKTKEAELFYKYFYGVEVEDKAGAKYVGDAIYSNKAIISRLTKNAPYRLLKQDEMKWLQAEATKLGIEFLNNTDLDLISSIDNEETITSFYAHLAFYGNNKVKSPSISNYQLFKVLKSKKFSNDLKSALVYYVFCARRLGNYMPVANHGFERKRDATMVDLKSKSAFKNFNDPLAFYGQYLPLQIEKSKSFKYQFKIINNVENLEEFIEKYQLDLLDFEGIKFSECKTEEECILWMRNACQFIIRRHNLLDSQVNC